MKSTEKKNGGSTKKINKELDVTRTTASDNVPEQKRKL